MAIKHKDITFANNHIAHAYEYADATARGAATGFLATDVGKLALQQSDNSLWQLTNHSPIAWESVVTAHEHTPAEVGLSNVSNLKNNFAASAAPTVDDDETAGYAVGSRWLVTSGTPASYICADASEGEARWLRTNGGEGTRVTALPDSGRTTAPCNHRSGFVASDGNIYMSGYAVSSYGQLGRGLQNVSRNALEPVAHDATDDPFVKFAMGYDTCFGITQSGKLYGWGYNANYELGQSGDTSHKGIPVRIGETEFGANTVEEVRVSSNNSIQATVHVLLSDGSIWGWGYQTTGYYHVGITGTSANVQTPQQLTTTTTPVKLKTTGDNSCWGMYIDSTGDLWGWGYNGNGNLGLGDTTHRDTPTKLIDSGDVIDFDIYSDDSNAFAIALKSDGTVWVTGYNGQGNLGLGDSTQRTSWTQITTTAPAWDMTTPADARVYATGGGSYNTSYVLDGAGDVWSCGYNGYGQLGWNGSTASNVFGQALSGENVEELYLCGGGSYTSVYAFAAGDVIWVWGSNNYGQLGAGDNTTRQTPEIMITPFTPKSLMPMGYASYIFVVVVDQDDQPWFCGYSNYGQDGTRSSNTDSIYTLTKMWVA